MKVLNKIILELKNQHKKQIDLTEFLGLHKNAFTEWKGGRSKSYIKYLPQIAEFLGVSVDYLLNDSENKKSPEIPEGMSERDADALRLYQGLISAGFIRQGETLTPEQVGTLKAVITLLNAGFNKPE